MGVLLAASAVFGAAAMAPAADELHGPPAPLSRDEVIAASFPSYQTDEGRATAMRVSRAVNWSLTGCDVVGTLIPVHRERAGVRYEAREAHPLAFGSKWVGSGLSIARTEGLLRLEAKARRHHRPGWAAAARWLNIAWGALGCGSQVAVRVAW